MAKKSDIEIDLSVNGLAAVRAAFSGVARGGVDAGKKIEKATDGTERGFVSLQGTIRRTTSGIRGMSAALRAVGTIGVAGVVGGAGLMVAAFARARTEIDGTAARLAEMANAGVAAGVDDPRRFGGFRHAIEQIGGSAEDAMTILRELYKTAFDGRAGDEAAIEKLAALGTHWEDIIDSNGEMRDTVDMVGRMSDSYARYADELDALRAAQEIAGDAGVHLARVMSGGSKTLEDQIRDYERLTDIRDGDIELSREYVRQLSAEKYALEGLQNSFFRGYAGGAIETKGIKIDGMIEARDQAERLGASMSQLALVSMPLMIAASERGAQGLEELSNFLRTGQSDAPWIAAVQDGLGRVEAGAVAVGEAFVGMRETYRAAVEYANNHVIPALGTTLAGALGDVMTLISTGATDAPWLTSIMSRIDGFIERMDRVFGVLGAIQDAVFGFADMISSGLEKAFGLDVSSTAVVAGLVLFSGTISKLVPLVGGLFGALTKTAGILTGVISGVGQLLTGLDKAAAMSDAIEGKSGKWTRGRAALGLGAAAAGSAAAVGGTYLAVTSTADLDREMSAMSTRVNELAAEHGQEYAAAYMIAFLDRVPKEFQTAGLINRAAGLVGLGPDFESAVADATAVIEDGGEAATDAVRAGFVQAFRDYGWGIDANGTLDIAAGITISGADLSSGVLADLGSIDATIHVSQLSGLDDAINESLSALAAPALSGGGLDAAPGPGAGLAPVNIYFGTEAVGGLYGTPDAISQLERAAHLTRRGRV